MSDTPTTSTSQPIVEVQLGLSQGSGRCLFAPQSQGKAQLTPWTPGNTTMMTMIGSIAARGYDFALCFAVIFFCLCSILTICYALISGCPILQYTGTGIAITSHDSGSRLPVDGWTFSDRIAECWKHRSSALDGVPINKLYQAYSSQFAYYNLIYLYD